MEQNKFKIFLKEETGPYELPKGWQWVKLGEVANVYYGKGLPQNQRRANGQYWAYGSNGPIYKTDFYLIEPPTIIMGRKGSIGAVTLVLDKCWPIDTTYYFKIKEKATNINYLYWYLKTIDFSKIAITTTKPGLNRDDLNSTKIPLPPLPEQKRIVARIEALFSKIDEIKRLRKEANDLAKTLMPSALHEVFSKADEKGWKWVRLGEILDLSNGKSITKKEMKEDGAYLVYGSNGVIGKANKYLINKDTIVIGRVGACGVVNIAKAPAWISDNAMYVSKLSDDIDILFLYYALTHLDLSRLAKIVAQPSISQEPIKEQKIPIPFKNGQPALDEQKRIIAYLDTIQQKAQTLQKLQTETEKEIERLRETILHKAFRGEL